MKTVIFKGSYGFGSGYFGHGVNLPINKPVEIPDNVYEKLIKKFGETILQIYDEKSFVEDIPKEKTKEIKQAIEVDNVETEVTKKKKIRKRKTLKG